MTVLIVVLAIRIRIKRYCYILTYTWKKYFHFLCFRATYWNNTLGLFALHNFFFRKKNVNCIAHLNKCFITNAVDTLVLVTRKLVTTQTLGIYLERKCTKMTKSSWSNISSSRIQKRKWFQNMHSLIIIDIVQCLSLFLL